jgi:hypothetical protein
MHNLFEHNRIDVERGVQKRMFGRLSTGNWPGARWCVPTEQSILTRWEMGGNVSSAFFS